MSLLLSTQNQPLAQIRSSHPTTSSLMSCLEWGVQEAYLRHLDLALVRFFFGLQNHLSDENLFPLLWLVALLSHYQSQGHPCISLRAVMAKEVDLFRDSQSPKKEFLRLNYTPLLDHLPKSLDLWRNALCGSSLVCHFDSTVTASETKVLGSEFNRQSDDPTSSYSTQLSQASVVLLPVERDVLVYFKRQWLAEDFIARCLLNKSRIVFERDENLVKERLNLLFDESTVKQSPTAEQEKSIKISSEDALDWQKIACALSLKSSLSVITGGPGTGKTYTVARLIALAVMLHKHERPLRIALAAPTGKAASRLYRSIESSLLSLSTCLEGYLDTRALVEHIGVAKTLHTLLGYQMHEKKFRFHERRTLPLDLLILDEASMVDAELMCALLKALQPTTTLILLGDKDQLSSVEVGSILAELSGSSHPLKSNQLGEIYEPFQVAYLSRVLGLSLEAQASTPLRSTFPFNNGVTLQRSRRFSGHLAELAQAINSGDQEGVGRVLIKSHSSDIHCTSSVRMDALLDVCLRQAESLLPKGQNADLFKDELKPNFLNYLRVLQRNGALPHSPIQREALGASLGGKGINEIDIKGDSKDWIMEALIEFERFRVLCAINEGPLGSLVINQAIEKRLHKEGWIDPSGEWYSGRAIMLTRNQHELGLTNGDVGLVLSDRSVQGSQTSFRAYFLSGTAFQSVSIHRLLSVQTAFAMSIHKSQGSEYEHAMVVLQDHAERSLSRELLYTGVTRAKKYLSLFQAHSGLIEQAVSLRAKRTSGLARRIQQLASQDEGERP